MPSCGRKPETASCGPLRNLQAALAEPRGPAPSRTLWMHESLLDEARWLWEQMATHLGYQATDRRQDPADSP